MSPPTDAGIGEHPSLPPVPALPEPVDNDGIHHEDAVATAVDHAAAALAVVGEQHHHMEVPPGVTHQGHHEEQHGMAPQDIGVEGGEMVMTPKKRIKKLPLTFHEALTFASRGIYIDIESGQLRCSCNHKPMDKNDAYGYTRHFNFKCHKKYEEERMDDQEIQRLREAKDTYLRMNPIIEESSLRRRKRKRGGEGEEKILSVDELRVQERHWMEMWKDAKNELKQLRADLKNEVDEDVRAELIADIEGLKRRKGDWAKLLGLNDAPVAAVAML